MTALTIQGRSNIERPRRSSGPKILASSFPLPSPPVDLNPWSIRSSDPTFQTPSLRFWSGPKKPMSQSSTQSASDDIPLDRHVLRIKYTFRSRYYENTLNRAREGNSSDRYLVWRDEKKMEIPLYVLKQLVATFAPPFPLTRPFSHFRPDWLIQNSTGIQLR